jgi:hypothetical protein
MKQAKNKGILASKRVARFLEGRKIFKSNSEGRQQKKFENPCPKAFVTLGILTTNIKITLIFGRNFERTIQIYPPEFTTLKICRKFIFNYIENINDND